MFHRWVEGFPGRVGGFPGGRVNGYPRRMVGGFPRVDHSLGKVNGCWIGPLCHMMTFFGVGGVSLEGFRVSKVGLWVGEF